MRKVVTLAAITLLLTGCGGQAAKQEESSVSVISIEKTAEPTVEVTNRKDNVRTAMTDYSHYAVPDDSGFAYYIYDDPDVSSEILPSNEKSSAKVILFTFDDFPRGENTQAIRIAEQLKEKNVGAIFLANGMYLETPEGKEVLRQVHEMGFEIGNHTQTHANLRELTYEEQYAEIAETNRLVYEITGEPVRWFRPPFGKFNMDTIHICNELGLQLMTWTLGYDWMEEYQEGNLLAKVSVESDHLHNGANILMHDLAWTADGISAMVDGYRAKGYEIVDPYLIVRQDNSTAPLQAE